MTLQEFKSMKGITSLNFYPSTHSNRRVAGLPNGELVVTTTDFNPKEQAYVYSNPAAEGNGWVVSNKQPKDAEFSL